MLMRVALYVLCFFAAVAHGTHFRYVIVGAGPAGLQLGYHLSRLKVDHIILERNAEPGSFFKKYPVHRKLISTNTISTGSDDWEFNERHDWNSILIDRDEKRRKIRFSDYSLEFMPHADDMRRYLLDYEFTYDIRVRYNTTVVKIARENKRKGRFYVDVMQWENGVQSAQVYSADVVIMATGMFKPVVPARVIGMDLAEGYEDFNPATALEKYKHKKVLILGTGNSAFEIANNISGITNFIEMCSRSPPKFSWHSHYAGDLRAINAGFLDTYQLKMQNFITTCNIDDTFSLVKRSDGQLEVNLPISDHEQLDEWQLWQRKSKQRDPTLQSTYDVVIRALGYKWDRSMFDDVIKPRQDRNGKYPALTPKWESVNVPGLYFAGTMMAGRDDKRSSVFGIHGFRYATQALARFLAFKYEDMDWPSQRLKNDAAAIASVMIERAQYSASLYQMYGVMCEVFWYDNSTDIEEPATWVHETEVPCDYVFTAQEYQTRSFFVLTLEYHPDFGKTREKFNVFGEDKVHPKLHPDRGHLGNFLHPVIRYFTAYNLDGSIDEAYLTSWALYRDQAHQGQPVTWWKPPDTASPASAEHHIMENILIDFGKLSHDIEPLVRFLVGVLGTRPELLPADVQSPIYRVKPDKSQHDSLHPQGWIQDLLKENPKYTLKLMKALRAQMLKRADTEDGEESEHDELNDALPDFDEDDIMGSYEGVKERMDKFSGVPVVDKTAEQLEDTLKHLKTMQDRTAGLKALTDQVNEMHDTIGELRNNVPKNPMHDMKEQLKEMTDFVKNFRDKEGADEKKKRSKRTKRSKARRRTRTEL